MHNSLNGVMLMKSVWHITICRLKYFSDVPKQFNKYKIHISSYQILYMTDEATVKKQKKTRHGQNVAVIYRRTRELYPHVHSKRINS